LPEEVMISLVNISTNCYFENWEFIASLQHCSELSYCPSRFLLSTVCAEGN
jgi:hypothetical protein